MKRKVVLLALLAFLGISNHLQMFFFFSVHAAPICIQFVSNAELLVLLGKICVNENELCE